MPAIVVPRGILPFHLQQRPVRGRLVRLGPLAEALLSRHDHPPAVRRLTGEALALTAGLAAALKFQGSFSLQVRGDGPISLLLADCTESGALRGYARLHSERFAALIATTTAEPSTAGPSAAHLFGRGYLAFTCDQGPAMERYQGIVALAGDSLTAMASHYFRTSEQLATHLHLAAAPTPQGWRAGALVMERLAPNTAETQARPAEEADEAWRTAIAFAATLSDAELLDDRLAGERLLARLFGAQGVVIGRPRPLSFGCRCSRARLAGLLSGFSPEELDHMAEDGTITMTCEFCNVRFHFDRTAFGSASRA